MKIKGKAWLILVTAVGLAAGCGKSAKEPAKEEAGERWEQPPGERIANEALEKASTGDVDTAVAILEKGLAETEGEVRARLFTLELSLLLDNGRMEAAQARYLAIVTNTAESALAMAGLDMVDGYLFQQPEGLAAVLAWYDRLEAEGLPEPLKTPLLQKRIVALQNAGDFPAALSVLDKRGGELPEDAFSGLMSRQVQAALATVKLEAVEAAIVLLDARAEARPGLKTLAAASRIELAIARGDYDRAGELLFGEAALFDDGQTAGLLDKLARSATGAGKPDASDKVVEKALSAFADRPVTRARAARWWIAPARDAADLDKGVDRLEKMEGMGVSDEVLVDGVGALSQLVLPPATPPGAAARLMAFAGKLKERVKKETDVGLLAGVQLDAGFRLEDYAGLVKVLEAGVPGNDEKWHATMLNKVKAHLALKEGRLDEAVKRFRDFMAEIAAQEEQQHRDPVTDERVTKDMILGYNAKRIGDLYAEAKRAEDAAKAYAEAKSYYEKALKGFAEGDPEHKTVSAILAELASKGG